MIRWHFPRTELAEQFLDSFDIGSSNTLTLFAPLRMGKTVFVLNDLIPEAEARNYRTLYVSFWQFQEDPVACLRYGLKRPRTGKGCKGLFSEVGIATNASGPWAGVSVRVQPQIRPVEQSDLVALTEGFVPILRGRKKVLLCLDEVQHLATNKAFEPLVYFLRTLIDTHQDRLKVVFTGSSRDGLQKLFSRRNAPLFNSSSQIDLPELGSPFVEDVMDAFTQATGRKVGKTKAIAAFRLLGKVPYNFREIVDGLIRHGGTDIMEVSQEYRSTLIDVTDHTSVWDSLTPVEKAVLLQISQSCSGIYQDDSRQAIAAYLGQEQPVPVHTVQNTINRLRGSLIAPAGRSQWEFEDREFRQWVQDLGA